MTKFLGVDYGAKKIGLAVSDDAGMIAFPETVLKNDKNALPEIKKICKEKGINEIVLGESLTLAGEPNEISPVIAGFKEILEKETGLSVNLEKEFMTSTAARHFEGYMKGLRPDTARKVKREMTEVDASAAALILQRYLDKNKNAS